MSDKEKQSQNARNKEKNSEKCNKSDDEVQEKLPDPTSSQQQNCKASNHGGTTQQPNNAVKNVRQRNQQSGATASAITNSNAAAASYSLTTPQQRTRHGGSPTSQRHRSPGRAAVDGSGSDSSSPHRMRQGVSPQGRTRHASPQRTASPSNAHHHQRSREAPSSLSSGPLRNHGSQRRRRVQSECDVGMPDDMDIEEPSAQAQDNQAQGDLDFGPLEPLPAVVEHVPPPPLVAPLDDMGEPGPPPNQHPQGGGAGGAGVAGAAMVYNWQASRTTIRERLGYIFNSEVMADVHFVVGRGQQTQRIPAHKFVLSVGSAVFDAMFNGGMATTSNEVELPDIEAGAFLALLKFLYTDQVNIGPETVMTTLYTAKKYAVPALEKACVDFLKKNLSSDNAFMLLTQARLFDEPQLAALCLETIDKNTSEALAAEGFTDIDNETLCVVLERDTLGIRECKLFKAVGRWAEAECARRNLPNNPENQRAALDRALTLVRFPIMTVEEFAGGPAQSGLLLDREVVQLFLYFTVNPKPHVGFNDSPRCCLTGKEQCMSRFQQIESRWGYSGTCDRIRFVVNRKIFVVGFGLYGSIHGSAEYSVNIQIIQTDYGKVCGQNDASFQCDGSASTFRVMFKEPVEILPNQNYTACATLKGPDSYYGTKGLRKVTHESLNSGKVTFMFTYAAGNNNGTSVEDGQIPEIIFYT